MGVLLLPRLFSAAAAAAAAMDLPPATRKRRNFSRIFQECAAQVDLPAGMAAHGRMIISGFLPTFFVANCLLHMYVRCSRLDLAHHLFDHLPHRDTVTWNILLAGHAHAGAVAAARALFSAMPSRDAVSWNSLISGYSLAGDHHQSLALFSEMRRSGTVGMDRTTVAIVLKSCSAQQHSELGSQLHALAVRAGFDCDVMAGTAIADLYAKCGLLGDSLRLFHGLPEKSPVSWSTAIAACVLNGRLTDSLQIFKRMLRGGLPACQSAYASTFRACAAVPDARSGEQLHAHALKCDFSGDAIVGTAILDMYAKSGELEEAKRAFRLLPERGLQSWNAMVVGLGQSSEHHHSLELFRQMKRTGFGGDEVTFSGVLRACAGAGSAAEGAQVHGLAIKGGLHSDVCVANATADMYGKCGMLEEAYALFDEMPKRDAVSWNAIIAALEQNGRYEEALSHYNQMLRHGFFPDEFTFGSALKACASLQSLHGGEKIHGRVVKAGRGLDPFLGSALVDMYCKCGLLEEALQLHDRLEEQTNVSWNAVISGFSLQRRTEEAQMLFSSMLDLGLKPDSFTYATVLDICANLAIAGLGKQVHGQIAKRRLERDLFVSSTVVDMYSKCGNMEDSLRMFEELQERDVVAWNAMIGGYSQHGLGEEALRIFARMRAEKVNPNQATFVAVLRACAHIGSLEEGMTHFSSMSRDFGVDPQLEHYSCMVDLLGRSGRPREAMELILGMPFEADAVIWRTLLSVCRARGYLEMAEVAAGEVLRLEPEDSAAYVLLSGAYAEAGRWDEVSRLRRTMRERRMKKEPGCSWIEVEGVVRMFLAGDEGRLACRAMCDALDALAGEMKRSGYVPSFSLDPLIEEAAEEEEEGDDEHEEIIPLIY
ncbi:unnamed protein product [Spirodela intermedia]|uniref:Uncharacterized protein n=1 Tax=Spirodela intermedia TaxID=51605 RepID=A0A7I8LDP6_SPIIN|nr:unnamed protein product [Spirodela intermedia]